MTYDDFDNHFVFDWIPVPERENNRRKGDLSQPIRFVLKTKKVFYIKKNKKFEI